MFLHPHCIILSLIQMLSPEDKKVIYKCITSVYSEQTILYYIFLYHNVFFYIFDLLDLKQYKPCTIRTSVLYCIADASMSVTDKCAVIGADRFWSVTLTWCMVKGQKPIEFCIWTFLLIATHCHTKLSSLNGFQHRLRVRLCWNNCHPSDGLL